MRLYGAGGRIMKTLGFAATIAALPLIAGGLGLSPAVQAQQQTMRYSQWDSNRDGVITRGEWRGTRAAFNAADINRDGLLSGTEVQVPNRNTIRQPGDFDLNLDEDPNAGQPVGTSGTAVASRRQLFRRLDANNDGNVTRREWNGNRVTFDRNDLNGDGLITRREYVGIEAGVRPRAQAIGGRIVTVSPRTPWTATGITVNEGDVIVFDARGTAQLSGDANDVAIPAGARSERHAANAPLPDALAGALIGRIGNSAAFGIGNQTQLRAPASGQLYLGVNDDVLSDNRGGFRVSVSLP
jgi:hypothetical protein